MLLSSGELHARGDGGFGQGRIVPGSHGSVSINLEGYWNVELVECLNKNRDCYLRLANMEKEDRTFSMRLPQNLHSKVPWFQGKAHFTRTIHIDSSDVFDLNRLDLLLLGSIGSVDTTYINGQVVGRTGFLSRQRDDFSILSAHNLFRAYHIPARTLRYGTNTITVEAWALDVKSGVHLGPLVLGNYQNHLLTVYWKRFVRGYFPYAITIFMFAVILMYLVTMRYWKADRRFFILFVANGGYFIHSFYYIPIPIFVDYLSVLKLFWIGRIIAHFAIAIYLILQSGYRNNVINASIAAVAVIEIFLVYIQNSYTDYFAMTYWQHWSFIVLMWFPLLLYFLLPDRSTRRSFLAYAGFFPAVTIVFMNDTLIRGFRLQMPWMYHYFSPVNIVHFFFDLIYYFYEWKNKERSRGEQNVTEQKILLARDLHDMVGAQLSQLVVLGNRMHTESGRMISSVSLDALNRIRDLSQVMKGKKTGKSVHAILKDFESRLRNTGCQTVELKVNEEKSNTMDRERFRGVSEAYQNIQLERIISEWISNTLKHARADHITICYIEKRPLSKIVIWNSGAEFRWGGVSDTGGLKSIQNRVKQIRGRIRSRPWKSGTIMILSWKQL